MKSRVTVVLMGLLLGAAFLWFSMRSIDPGSFRHSLAGVRAEWAALASVLALLFVAVKALRWRRILEPIVTRDFRSLSCVVAAGIAANLVVTHIGELVRVRQIARRDGIAASAVLATIGVERVLDIAAVLMLVAAMLAHSPAFYGALASTVIVLAALVVAGAVLVLLWLHLPDRIADHFLVVLKHLPSRPTNWVVRQVSDSRVGVEVARSPGGLLWLVAVSLIQWACIFAAVWASCMAIGLSAPPGAAMAVLALMVVGITLPTAPGYLGTTQLAFVVGLGVTGVPAEHALAGSTVYSLAVSLFTLVLGAAAWLLGCGSRTGEPSRTRDQ